jgi:hypothetical protein
MDSTDVSQLPTDGPAVNAPASGTYGEGAALERLKASFPVNPAPAGQAPGPTPMPTPPTGAGIGTAPVGLPPGLALPTMQPSTPVATPLSAPAPNPAAVAQTARQRNLATLNALIDNPNTATETKEWAQIALRNLISSSSSQ